MAEGKIDIYPVKGRACKGRDGGAPFASAGWECGVISRSWLRLIGISADVHCRTLSREHRNESRWFWKRQCCRAHNHAAVAI